MQRALAGLMALLLAHLPVAGSWCVCGGEGDADGHGHAGHAPRGPARECEEHGDLEGSRDAAENPADPHDPPEPNGCECPASQPFMVPEAGPLEGRSPASGLAAAPAPAAFDLLAPAQHREGPGLGYPRRPPPLVRGVSSNSPTSLPKLQV